MSAPMPQDEVEAMVSRLERKIASKGAWMTSDLRAFYTEQHALLTRLTAQLKDALAVLERRRSIYEKKYAEAVAREWERDLDGTLNYGRSDLFKHAAEAIEHAIEEVSAALKGSAQE